MKKLIVCLLMLIVPVVVAAAGAPQAPALPALTLTSTTGAELALDTFGAEKKALLVVVSNGNAAGERLLTFLEALDGLPKERVAIVVSGADSVVTAAIAGHHPGITASWYADPEEKVAKGLTHKATPATLGVRNGFVTWTVIGLQDQERMEKTIRGWIGK